MSQRNSGKGKSAYQVPDSDDEAPSPTLLDEGDAPVFNPELIVIDDDYGGEEINLSHEQWLYDSAIRAANDLRFIDSLTTPQIHHLAKYVFQSPLYAVRRGLYPGVYRTWSAAQRVVDDWMPNGRFGATRSGSLRRFNCPIQAWRFVSRDDWGGTGSYDDTNTSAALQSLPPPAGFTIPAPMFIATAGGALQHLEPPIPPPVVEAGEPLPLLNGDNNDFRRLPAGVCIGDARVHYHRINGEIVLCGPTNRPSTVVSIKTVADLNVVIPYCHIAVRFADSHSRFARSGLHSLSSDVLAYAPPTARALGFVYFFLVPASTVPFNAVPAACINLEGNDFVPTVELSRSG
ncbi:hypothetical protein FRC09_012870 [Ceratobasidium sp. 395]|nr:hypothetical protein FRC09_012870 [Ceratobasidium sp. 395]